MNKGLDLLLEQLLHRFECVILPDFGGFIVRDSPCNFNASKDRIKPSAKHIFFNPHLTLNDGLILNEIQLEFGMTYNEATDWYNKTIADYKRVISEAGSMQLGKLGTFFQGKENNYWFSPSNDINLSLDTYGLFPIEVHQVAKSKEVELTPELTEAPVLETEIKADNKQIETTETTFRINYKGWLAAASIALLTHFVYLKVEKTDVTTNEASVLPTFEPAPVKDIPQDTASFSDSYSNIDTSAELIQAPLQNDDLENLNNANAIVETPEVMIVEETKPDQVIAKESPIETSVLEIKAPVVQNEAIQSPDEIPATTYQRVARYKLEINALSHKLDLEKKGKTCKIEQNGNMFEVMVEQ